MTLNITQWLIRRRDTAAHRWIELQEGDPSREIRARRRLMMWDGALVAWTDNGRRRI